VAQLSEYFGTPSNSLEAVERFSDKYVSREFINQKFGNHHLPKYAKVSNTQDLKKFQDDLREDIIVKPTDSQSSRGIFVVGKNDDPQMFLEQIEESLVGSRNNYLIAEEFIKGTEITIEGVVTEFGHKILAASRKKHFRTGIASDLEYPLDITTGLWDKISNFYNKIINSTGLRLGLTHTEFLINFETEQFYLVEMACRGGGTLIPSDIVNWVSGISPYQIFYHQLTRNETQVLDKLIPETRAAKLHFFEFPSGKVKQIYGVEKARNISGVHRLEFEFECGDCIQPACNDRGRQGFVIIKGETSEEVLKIQKKVYETISVEYTKDEKLAVC
jgi:carbamoyl-phosphate synthase large subunit